MKRLKEIFFREHVLVFLFCFALIQGPAFSLMDNYNAMENVDCQTYIGVAHLDFNQSPVRRYRVIVPLAARIVDKTFGSVFKKMEPMTFPGDFPLSLSFFIVNCLLMSISGVLVFRYCKAYQSGILASLTGLLAMLSCRWTPYYAGLPFVDSLYFLVTVLTLLGIKEKNTKYLVLAIFIGPFAKESFVFIAPLIFFFSHLPKLRQVVLFALSGLLVFSFRYLYDTYAGFPPGSGMAADVNHVEYLLPSVRKLFSFHGAYDVLSNFGLWILAPIVALRTVPGYVRMVKNKMELYIVFFLLGVLVQMLLSGGLERMFYLTMPVISLVISLTFDEMYKQYSNAKNKFI